MGQKLLAQSNTLGIRAISLAICRGKSFQITKIQVQYFLTSFSNLITPFDTKLIFSHENTKEKAQKLAEERNIAYFCIIFVGLRGKDEKMEQENNRIQLPLEEIKLAFAASCVEGAARKLGVPYIEIYERMRKVDLINKFILPHYDTLHTESREYLIEDVIECLTNWEKKD